MITIHRNHIKSVSSHHGDQTTGKNRRLVLATAFVMTTAIASIPSMASAASDGTLDTTFGTGGKVLTDIGGGQDMGNSTALQSDGKIIVAGSSGDDFAVVRYNIDGSLDTTFDTDGKVTTDINSGLDSGQSVAIQSNGKIIVVGPGRSGLNQNFAVVRYNTDGSLDTSFDSDGKVTTDIGISTSDTANAVVIQSDGNIVVAGQSDSDFAVVRYTTTGALDTTFDTDGKATTDIGTSTSDMGKSVVIQSGGKIIVAGARFSGNWDFVVVRYEATAITPSSSSSSSSTSTTVEATTTTVAAAGTTVAAASTTTTNAVVKRTATAAANTPGTTLPETGSNSSLPATIGAFLLVVGLVLATRRRLVN